MSDNYLHLVPCDPEFDPDPPRVAEAVKLLASFLPNADDVSVRQSEEVQFIDQGENFERVLCPGCGSDLTELWGDWMDEAAASGFRSRDISPPCCGAETELNGLVYEWPAAFGRFLLTALNPRMGGWLPQDQQTAIEEILGCPLRQVLSHV
jgi:hypothetical protein